MPALDRRLNIPIKSGTAANVVPRPATKPKNSDRVNRGASRLAVSCGTRSAQPHSASALTKRIANINLLNRTDRISITPFLHGLGRHPYMTRVTPSPSASAPVSLGFVAGGRHPARRASVKLRSQHGFVTFLIGPPPAYDLGVVDTMLVGVVAAIGLLIAIFLLRMSPDPLELRGAVDHVNRQGEAIDLVVNR